MRRFLLFRITSAALSLLLVSAVTFFSVALAPGDAASQMLGERATPALLAQWRQQYGLDKPITTRYLLWLGELLHGKMGDSLISQRPVSAVLLPAAQRSLSLALAAAAVMLVVGGIGGCIAAFNQARWPDRILSFLALSGLSIPEFMLATLLVLVFSTLLGWLPAVSLPSWSGEPSFGEQSFGEQWQILVLPALTLGLTASCYLLRMVRATLLQRINTPWVISARLNGVSGMSLLWRHILFGAWVPLMQIVAATLPYLLGGAIVVERLYGYPGLGDVLLNALYVRDGTLLQAVVMLLAFSSTLCWLAVDIFAVCIKVRSAT